MHDALKRRCLYHWIDHPGLEREVADRPDAGPRRSPTELAEQVVGLVQQLRGTGEPASSRPGVAETLDWARALRPIGAQELDVESAARDPGRGVKYREDAERVSSALDRMLADDDHDGAAAPRPTSCCSASPARCAPPGCQSPHDRAQPSCAAAAVARPRRPAGHLLGRPGHAVRRAGRPRRYDQVFSAWFLPRTPRRAGPGHRTAPPVVQAPSRRPTRRRGAGARTTTALRVAASEAEVLRHRDIATLTRRGEGPAGRAVRRPCTRVRRGAAARRRTAWHRGERRRPAARCGGRCAGWGSRPRSPSGAARTRPRRVVLLVDVSGSMSPYADALLRLAHRFVVSTGSTTGTARPPGAPRLANGAEVFTVGTRLTRVTRAMRLRDPDRAIVAAGRDRPGLVGRHPARRDAAGVPRPVGPARDGPRRRRGRVQRRLGARRRRTCSASRCAGCTGSRTGWCG